MARVVVRVEAELTVATVEASLATVTVSVAMEAVAREDVAKGEAREAEATEGELRAAEVTTAAEKVAEELAVVRAQRRSRTSSSGVPPPSHRTSFRSAKEPRPGAPLKRWRCWCWPCWQPQRWA